MFYKILKDTDISHTSYRCRKDVDDFIYIEYIDGYIDNSWNEVLREEIELIAPDWFEETIEVTQLDRIENAISISNEELRQEGADNLTESLIRSGIL